MTTNAAENLVDVRVDVMVQNSKGRLEWLNRVNLTSVDEVGLLLTVDTERRAFIPWRVVIGVIESSAGGKESTIDDLESLWGDDD